MLDQMQYVTRAQESTRLNDVYGQVETLLRTTCALEGIAIRKDRPLIEYGIDSVRAVDVIVELEQTFGIEIHDETAYRLRTLNDVVVYVQSQVANRF